METAAATTATLQAPAAESTTPESLPAQTTTSMLDLIRDLTSEARTLMRQQLKLAQTELLEKAKRLGHDATTLVIGGFVAYAGAIVFLISLGLLVAWAIRLAGVEPLLANFLGLLAIGLGVASIGGILVRRGLRTLSEEPLKPQRTLQSLQELRTGQPAVEPALALSRAPCSTEMQARVEATQSRMGETLDELGRRFSPQHMNARVKRRIQARPYRSGIVALGAGLLSGRYVRRRFRRG